MCRRDDALKTWAKARKTLFRRPTPQLLATVQQVLVRFPNLIDPEAPNADQADPFVIALARVTASNTYLLQGNCTVVTEEHYKPNCTKIPHVCEAYGLHYMTIHQMFVMEKLTF